ncbi:MAG: AAA family ATPase [Blastocatellia bacterium]|nr:AAA family ATPase [Blastocatellia bacterium]
MIESVEFHNFKALRDTVLPLSRFTLIVGPNGSGKSTALQALQAVGNPRQVEYHRTISAEIQASDEPIKVVVNWGSPYAGTETSTTWFSKGRTDDLEYNNLPANSTERNNYLFNIDHTLRGVRIYSLDAQAIAHPTQLRPNMTLASNGANLAGVLDRLRDNEPERFEALNKELGRWLPEFDRILFDTPSNCLRAILLRTREGHHKIPAADLSQGILLALAMLTLAYIPDPPPIICLEEPDRGIHPRLLRDVQDVLYRLSYPESCGEKRDPVQVIATTHSPYLLDLYKDHPEEIVIANKIGQEVRFERLSDHSHLDEILRDAQLGEIWYSGILGGVPHNT